MNDTIQTDKLPNDIQDIQNHQNDTQQNSTFCIQTATLSRALRASAHWCILTNVILIDVAAPYRWNQTTHASLISTDEVKIELSRIEDFKMKFQRGKVRVLWQMLYNCFRVGVTF